MQFNEHNSMVHNLMVHNLMVSFYDGVHMHA